MYGNPITFLCLGLSVLSCLSIFLWPIAVYMSVFLFDAPNSMAKILNWVVLFLLLSYPAPVVLGTLKAAKAHKETKTLESLVCPFISYSNFAVLYGMMVLNLW